MSRAPSKYPSQQGKGMRRKEGYLLQLIQRDPIGDTGLMDSFPLFESQDFYRTPLSPLWSGSSSDMTCMLWALGVEELLYLGSAENKPVQSSADWGSWGKFRVTKSHRERGRGGAAVTGEGRPARSSRLSRTPSVIDNGGAAPAHTAGREKCPQGLAGRDGGGAEGSRLRQTALSHWLPGKSLKTSSKFQQN